MSRTINRISSALYRAARLSRDVNAAVQGPAPFVKRRVRAFGMAKWAGLFRRIFKV
jgi:hypothetical protein